MTSPRVRQSVLLLAVGLSGCGLIEVPLEGASCGAGHDCPAGLTCQQSVCVLSTAQLPVFADDFEGPTLVSSESPPGRWSSSQVATGNSVRPSAVAAHRGDGGLRSVDTDTRDVFAAYVSWNSLSGGDLSVRGWVRVVSSNDQGETSIMKSEEPLYMKGQWDLSTGPNGTLRLGAWYHGGRDFDFQASDAGVLVPGAWRLVEVVSRGGSADASCELFVDGARLLAIEHLDQMPDSGGIDVGAFFQTNPAVQITIDWDDVRVAFAPQATKLEVVPIRQEAGKPCAEYEVRLLSALGQPQAAPYDVQVTGSTELFSSADCQPPAPVVPRGATRGRVFAHSGEPLSVQHPDFLGSSPAQAPAGCSSTGGWGGLGLLAWLVMAGRWRGKNKGWNLAARGRV